MDWKTLATVFAALFLAELGDKTQLAVISFTATGANRWAVLAGASLALIASTLLAVLVGQALLRVVPAEYLRLAAAVVFVVVGVLVGGDAIREVRAGS